MTSLRLTGAEFRSRENGCTFHFTLVLARWSSGTGWKGLGGCNSQPTKVLYGGVTLGTVSLLVASGGVSGTNVGSKNNNMDL
jgi:hypothetical protein